MDHIGIYGKFTYGGNEYAIRHFKEADYCDDEIMHFKYKENLRAYLITLQRDPVIWTVFNAVTRNFGLGTCRASFKECDRENLNFLCDKIYSEEWVLIQRKYHNMKDIKLEDCCIEVTQIINRRITCGAILMAVEIALPFFKALFYPYKELPATILSSAISIAQEDWRNLAEAIKGVNGATRRMVSQDAELHVLKHDYPHYNRKLVRVWREISYAFA